MLVTLQFIIFALAIFSFCLDIHVRRKYHKLLTDKIKDVKAHCRMLSSAYLILREEFNTHTHEYIFDDGTLFIKGPQTEDVESIINRLTEERNGDGENNVKQP